MKVCKDKVSNEEFSVVKLEDGYKLYSHNNGDGNKDKKVSFEEYESNFEEICEEDDEDEKIGDGFIGSILDQVQQQVNVLSKERWKDDRCLPEFLVSLGHNGKTDIILLTVSHLGNSFTEVVFPRDDSYHGYDELSDMMISMYNRTM